LFFLLQKQLLVFGGLFPWFGFAERLSKQDHCVRTDEQAKVPAPAFSANLPNLPPPDPVPAINIFAPVRMYV
jgi:hypothetical protein